MPAEAILFYSYGDVVTYRKMFLRDAVDEEHTRNKLEKLERMYAMTQSPVCRRKMILVYFGESYPDSCGNCDVCVRPPRRFDGTIAAQKALSALKHTGERIGMHLLVDILRGSRQHDILAYGYHQIKTYGAGMEYSREEWLFLISQMLHMGLMETAYGENNVLRVTEEGYRVLFEGQKVMLALPPERVSQTVSSLAVGERSSEEQRREELFQRLRELRRRIALRQGLPPYVVFHDTVLEEMARRCPLFAFDLYTIRGIGERTMEQFGAAFLQEIRTFALEKHAQGEHFPGIGCIQTLPLFQQGHTVEEIAEQRKLQTSAVLNHLMASYERGEAIDISLWLTEEARFDIERVLTSSSEPFALADIYERTGERYTYDQIRWAIADYRRRQHRLG